MIDLCPVFLLIYIRILLEFIGVSYESWDFYYAVRISRRDIRPIKIQYSNDRRHWWFFFLLRFIFSFSFFFFLNRFSNNDKSFMKYDINGLFLGF